MLSILVRNGRLISDLSSSGATQTVPRALFLSFALLRPFPKAASYATQIISHFLALSFVLLHPSHLFSSRAL